MKKKKRDRCTDRLSVENHLYTHICVLCDADLSVKESKKKMCFCGLLRHTVFVFLIKNETYLLYEVKLKESAC